MPFVYPDKTCLCGKTFTPRSHRHRICDECAKDPKLHMRMMRYGVTQAQIDAMLLRQDGHCALCPKPAIYLDHDHATNKIRGMLCAGCNSALNRVEMPGWVEKALAYLKENTCDLSK